MRICYCIRINLRCFNYFCKILQAIIEKKIGNTLKIFILCIYKCKYAVYSQRINQKNYFLYLSFKTNFIIEKNSKIFLKIYQKYF